MKFKNQDELKAKNRHHPVAAYHFHITKSGEALISLYRKSNFLWWLPDPTVAHLAANDPILWLSTDSRLHFGSGPWPNLYPIKILNPNWLAKAVLTLLCRDGGASQTGWGMWYCMVQCLIEWENLAFEKGTQYFQPEYAVILLRKMCGKTLAERELFNNDNYFCVESKVPQ
ncbi:hypothetical protein BJY01DRAFT_201760 [Aspergillus pseudoustus]|uniref:Uncharacterized protein n=1 Tax=Aspergillus pseudoustus TaxID=1810923 RepID=A0ABR4L0H5_9EURO